jgi:hypothetical protein
MREYPTISRAYGIVEIPQRMSRIAPTITAVASTVAAERVTSDAVSARFTHAGFGTLPMA